MVVVAGGGGKVVVVVVGAGTVVVGGAVVVVVAGGAVVAVVATGPVVVRNRRVEDHAPATPVGPLARTRHQRSTLAPGIDPVVSCDAVTVWLTRIGALNALESSIWIV